VKKLALLVALISVAVLATSAVARSSGSGSCRVGFWLGPHYYSGVVTRSVRTSCPFARNVTRVSLRFIIRAGGAGDGDFYVRAWSPITVRWYRVHCDAHGDLYSGGVRADCRAGHGAHVLYRAWSN
jgi:hypothetical protein